MRIGGVQANLTVGDLGANEARILESMEWAESQQVDLLLLPELAVTGYPPEDLVLRPDFVAKNLEIVDRLAEHSGACTTVVGFVDRADSAKSSGDAVERTISNAAALLRGGEIVGTYHKVMLPNYGVFDEDRYFTPGADPGAIFEVAGILVGVSICEDIWVPGGPPEIQAERGAGLLVNISASPFHRGKARQREAMLSGMAARTSLPVVLVNLVGGQDELVFDGASAVAGRRGEILHRSPQFEEDRFVFDLDPGCSGRIAELMQPPEELYRALSLGVRDYVRKNGFERALIGLSGGIDSALTAVIAVDALGPENVWGVSMPTRYSSEGSIEDSRKLAKNLGIQFDVVPIDTVFQAFLDALDPLFSGTPFGVTEENLQARVRGTVLMGLSNKFGPIVLTTGNKSEVAVGYSTLYGDMAGGFGVLKDVFKTQVYELARWRNHISEAIPISSIEKPPSAELRPDQRDSDSLPPYDLLDSVLEAYIEGDVSEGGLVTMGFEESLVRRVVSMVDRSEYKRRQSAPGVRVTPKGFGRDRRIPITNHYRH